MTLRARHPTLSAAGPALVATSVGALATDSAGWYGHLVVRPNGPFG